MSIPFIRGFPSGARSLQDITRPFQIERKAKKFIAHGGRYLIEIQTDGKVSLIAIIDVNGTAKDVARELCDNGPDLPLAVDALVLESVQHIPKTSDISRLIVPAHLAEMKTLQ